MCPFSPSSQFFKVGGGSFTGEVFLCSHLIANFFSLKDLYIIETVGCLLPHWGGQFDLGRMLWDWLQTDVSVPFCAAALFVPSPLNILVEYSGEAEC